MEKQLQQFYKNEHERDAVKAFLVDQLSEEAVKKVFAGSDTSGVREARELIEAAFNKLHDMFGEIKKNKPESSR